MTPFNRAANQAAQGGGVQSGSGSHTGLLTTLTLVREKSARVSAV